MELWDHAEVRSVDKLAEDLRQLIPEIRNLYTDVELQDALVTCCTTHHLQPVFTSLHKLLSKFLQREKRVQKMNTRIHKLEGQNELLRHELLCTHEDLMAERRKRNPANYNDSDDEYNDEESFDTEKWDDTILTSPTTDFSGFSHGHSEEEVVVEANRNNVDAVRDPQNQEETAPSEQPFFEDEDAKSEPNYDEDDDGALLHQHDFSDDATLAFKQRGRRKRIVKKVHGGKFKHGRINPNDIRFKKNSEILKSEQLNLIRNSPPCSPPVNDGYLMATEELGAKQQYTVDLWNFKIHDPAEPITFQQQNLDRQYSTHSDDTNNNQAPSSNRSRSSRSRNGTSRSGSVVETKDESEATNQQASKSRRKQQQQRSSRRSVSNEKTEQGAHMRPISVFDVPVINHRDKDSPMALTPMTPMTPIDVDSFQYQYPTTALGTDSLSSIGSSVDYNVSIDTSAATVTESTAVNGDDIEMSVLENTARNGKGQSYLTSQLLR